MSSGLQKGSLNYLILDLPCGLLQYNPPLSSLVQGSFLIWICREQSYIKKFGWVKGHPTMQFKFRLEFVVFYVNWLDNVHSIRTV